MRFLFVDRITDLDENENMIRGHRSFTANDPMQYPGVGGVMQISPGVVSEAVGQLISWLCLKKNNFTARPVFLFANAITVHGAVKPGTTVSLYGKLEVFNEETNVFSGTARDGDRPILTIKSCSGFFMPLAQLEDPDLCRKSFEALTSKGLSFNDHSEIFNFESLVDEITELNPGQSITIRKKMRLDEPFYPDHFPRFPVTPIVMINEMIGQAAKKLLTDTGPHRFIFPREAAGVKIKSFLKPGEVCDVKVRVMGRQPKPDHSGEHVSLMVEMFKEEKSILRGRYTYELSWLPPGSQKVKVLRVKNHKIRDLQVIFQWK